MAAVRRTENFYTCRLQKYFNKFYCEYAETVEFYVNPNINQWHFVIRELGFIDILLTCHDDGRITEYRLYAEDDYK